MNQGIETNLLSYYGTLVAKVGTDTNKASFTWEYEATLASDLDARQAEISGVNLDEELTLLISIRTHIKLRPSWSLPPIRCSRPCLGSSNRFLS
jgi:Flagellar hook-associated protein